jgi:hypothetical protein
LCDGAFPGIRLRHGLICIYTHTDTYTQSGHRFLVRLKSLPITKSMQRESLFCKELKPDVEAEISALGRAGVGLVVFI